MYLQTRPSLRWLTYSNNVHTNNDPPCLIHSFGQSVYHFGPDWNISTTTWLIAMKFYPVIHGSPEDQSYWSSDFSSSTAMRLTFVIFIEMSIWWIAKKHTFMFSSWWIVITSNFDDALTFPLVLSPGLNFIEANFCWCDEKKKRSSKSL